MDHLLTKRDRVGKEVKGGSGGRGHIYSCGQFMLMYGKNHHNISKQRASLVTKPVKSLPAMRETWVKFLGQKDPLEMEMATHSTILSWRIPWTEEPGVLQTMGSQRVGLD